MIIVCASEYLEVIADGDVVQEDPIVARRREDRQIAADIDIVHTDDIVPGAESRVNRPDGRGSDKRRLSAIDGRTTPSGYDQLSRLVLRDV